MSRWLLLTAAAPPPSEALLMVDALHRLGARSVERDGPRVIALFSPHDDPDSLAADAALAIRASTSIPDPDLAWRWLEPDEWTERWGAAEPARRVSERLVVAIGDGHGNGDGDGDEDADGAVGEDAERDADAEALRVIRLAPSAAFGSADHPTTRACLRTLDRSVRAGDRVLDLGAGSGILAIAAVVLDADRAVAVEADPVACEAARRNVALNGLGGRVRIEESEVRPGSLARRTGGGRWDGVVANIQSVILALLIPDIAAAVADDGWVILSGVLRAERDGVVEAAESAGLRVTGEEVDDGWWTGRLTR